MGKKPKAKAEKAEPKDPAPADAADPWLCPECEQDNPCEEAACIACEAPKPAGAADAKFENFVVALVQSCEAVPGKDKLKKLEVDVGGEVLKIVTNASNVKDGSRVVVAKVGAIIDGEPLKKSVVGGCPSEGMLCDSTMLGWSGGGSGAALLPDSFALGAPPPDARPRTDGK
ncbi:unnamed protein product [Cladocopium goreaui]|uniref:RanBP2-type domain-containing protein n=1 Tax=Cladocopium goreaui TaxID=2562237 RepID=A0A9P1BW24_9DINO|nr:unnamed protein product [Cladocopium goreaui]